MGSERDPRGSCSGGSGFMWTVGVDIVKYFDLTIIFPILDSLGSGLAFCADNTHPKLFISASSCNERKE